jgi:hypothetical protein
MKTRARSSAVKMSMRHTVPAIPPSLPPLLCSPQENPNPVLQGIAKASLLSVLPSQVTRVYTLRERRKEGATTA